MLDKEITFDRFIRWAIVGGVIIASLLVLNYLSAVLLPFFIAWVMAYLTYPLVTFIQYRMHVKIRAISILIAMFMVIAILSGVIYLIIPPMIEQFGQFSSLAMGYLHQAAHIKSIPDAVTQWVNDNSNEIERYLKSPDFSTSIKAAMPKLFQFIGQTWNVVMSIAASCITLLCSSYFSTTNISPKTGLRYSRNPRIPSGRSLPLTLEKHSTTMCVVSASWLSPWEYYSASASPSSISLWL